MNRIRNNNYVTGEEGNREQSKEGQQASGQQASNFALHVQSEAPVRHMLHQQHVFHLDIYSNNNKTFCCKQIC